MTGYRILYHHRIRADDGQAVHVRELIAALRAAGHDVRECALVEKTAVGAGAGDGERGAAGRRGAAWQKLSLPRPAVEAMEIGYDRYGVRMLRRAADEFEPHFIYERHALHCAAGLAVATARRVPLLLEVNSPMTDEMERLGLLRFARRARSTERRVLAGADAVLPVTAVLRDRLVALGARAERCHVIANGAQPERYGEAARRAGRALRAALPQGTFVLGFVGFLRDWHRLDLALEVLARPGFEAVQLWVVGEGPALDGLRGRSRELGVEARLRCEGVVPAAALPAHLCAFDAALIPAINEYASPLKLFDSLAAGVATLAPDQANLREIIANGDNGLLFAPGDVEALAATLRALVDDPERTAAIGAAGRRRLIERGWTWSDNARRVVEVYQRLGGSCD